MRIFLSVLGMLLPLISFSQPIVLVKDIYTGSQGSAPFNYVINAAKDKACFLAYGNTNRIGLWITDGSTNGTSLVKENLTNDATYYPVKPVFYNGYWYFSTDDGINGTELWKTDGSVAGTVLVKDIFPGSNSSYATGFVEYNNVLYFRAANALPEDEMFTYKFYLWKTDGTAGGTVQVDNTVTVEGEEYIVFNGQLYFYGNTTTTGSELYYTDGSAVTLLTDINSSGNSEAKNMIQLNSEMLFFANDGVTGPSLWKSDGTSANTQLVKDFDPNTPYWGKYSASPAKVFNNELYFDASDGMNNNELWKTDGTSAGTVMVKDIGPAGSGLIDLDAVEYNGRLYYTAASENGTSGMSIWTSDGTTSGTYLFKEINATSFGTPYGYFIYSDKFYFAASTPYFGTELWKSDGIEANTVMAYDLNSSNASGIGSLEHVILSNNEVLLSGTTNWEGEELFKFVDTGHDAIVSSVSDEELNLFPNPAHDQLMIHSSQNLQNIYVLDVMGIQRLEVESLNKDYSLDISSLEKGMYIVKVQMENGSFVQRKIVKE